MSEEIKNLEIEINNKISNLDIRLSLLEQKIDLLIHNHLHHIQKDITWLKFVLYAAMSGIIINLLGWIGFLLKH